MSEQGYEWTVAGEDEETRTGEHKEFEWDNVHGWVEVDDTPLD
ncbi:MAG: hypothetical protein ACRC8W_21200 [Plesiomonas shigelloides]